MKTSQMIREEFITNLKNLLNEYDATLEYETTYNGYGDKDRLHFWCPSKYDLATDSQVQAYTDFDIVEFI